MDPTLLPRQGLPGLRWVLCWTTLLGTRLLPGRRTQDMELPDNLRDPKIVSFSQSTEFVVGKEAGNTKAAFKFD